MSEEILKALMQLFAIIAKQDDGASQGERKFVEEFLIFQLSEDLVKEYIQLYDEFVGPAELDENGNPVKKLTSVKDSVKTLGICKKINKTLTQKQKVIVLVRLLELIAADGSFTEQRMAIANTVADVFKFDKSEFDAIVNFCVKETQELKAVPEILVINGEEQEWNYSCKHIVSHLDGNIVILKVISEDLYFLKYTGKSDVFLNGLPVNPRRMYLFATGSTIKMPGGKPVYYSDVVANFMADGSGIKLSFNADKVSFKFPNGAVGLRDINISEGSGKLIGLMGASGAGKTTLLNVLSGIENVSEGQVLINGINIHKEKDKIKGLIGYVPQDDLLIEELTVFQNLFYNAKLCFKKLSDLEITDLVMKVLNNLGLAETKDLKVGNPLQKTISGGQRKRLNIGLELIREPAVLFLDEPTSGLSSRDSENVMDLLRELTLKGKLIFVVIHQPSSDIYKMFDKIIFLDVGGYQIYYDNPVQAVVYFKQADHQVNAEQGQCLVCGNVNPEIIFNIIEAKIVDDYGNYTKKRKVSPLQWRQLYENKNLFSRSEDIKEAPAPSLNIPSWFKQFKIFSTRDLFSKLSNTQYLLINLLEAPVLAFILSFIIRYVEIPGADYIFRDNENIPAFIFMSIIVMLFIGLTVSAEEIFRDQKILKREKFLNLSKSSYLISKIGILFTLSAIQALLFVLIGNSIVGIKSMYFDYWLMLFSVSCFANLLGLNISASFNSAVTIYILIPLFVIPQMILGGAMFSFDKLNRSIGGGDKVPMVAEFMASRWAFEGLMVDQFIKNPYGKKYYQLDKKESITNYKQVYYLPRLNSILEDCNAVLYTPSASDSLKKQLESGLKTLQIEISKELKGVKRIKFDALDKLKPETFNEEVSERTKLYLDELTNYYADVFNAVNEKKNALNASMQGTAEKDLMFEKFNADYQNNYTKDILTKAFEKNKIVEINHNLIQKIDPIYMDPQNEGLFSFRSHFYAPKKFFANNNWYTFLFNLSVIWLMTILLYVTLYFDLLKRALIKLEKLTEKR